MPLGAARFGLISAVGGSLELIETQTVTSAVAQVDFTSIDESTYNVHFLTWNNQQQTSDNKRLIVQFFESGVLETASVYEFALQFYRGNGTFIESNGTTNANLGLCPNTRNTANFSANGYAYFYNFGDSSKYSFMTHQATTVDTSNGYGGQFGSGVLPQTSTVDGFRLSMTGGNIDTDTVFSLYGIGFA
tara:strand:+ start:1334 stop:1900 length:567 start_codon:yes stop_codon:yes gene_type:complete